VFNGPMASGVLPHVLRCRQGRRVAGNPLGQLPARLPRFFVPGKPFHHKGVSDMRKVSVAIQLGGHPDLAGFETTMVAIRGGKIGRVLTVGKIEGRLFQQLCVIALDGEVVVGPALVNHIARQLALREQGIGADGFSSDLDGLQQRNGSFDFIGLLLLIAPLYWQGPHFFGVSHWALCCPTTLMMWV